MSSSTTVKLWRSAAFIRYLLKPGDTALVDDPGYYNMFGNLRLQGVEMLAVPRNPDGPDVSFCAATATRRDARPAAHRPAAVGELRSTTREIGRASGRGRG